MFLLIYPTCFLDIDTKLMLRFPLFLLVCFFCFSSMSPPLLSPISNFLCIGIAMIACIAFIMFIICTAIIAIIKIPATDTISIFHAMIASSAFITTNAMIAIYVTFVCKHITVVATLNSLHFLEMVDEWFQGVFKIQA